MNAINALQQRDAAALMDAFSDLEEANDFRRRVLPQLSPADCRWFWQCVMTPDQLERTMNAVRDVCLAVADEFDLVAGVHYSLGMVDDLPTLICPSQVAQVFYARIPPDRHSVLRFYLQTAPSGLP
jgi:hypothetical protein